MSQLSDMSFGLKRKISLYQSRSCFSYVTLSTNSVMDSKYIYSIAVLEIL